MTGLVALRPCPACFIVDAAGSIQAPGRPALHVITADGVSHAVPAAWFADRRTQLEQNHVPAVDAIRGAYLAWAATCTRVTQ